jgi:hypothetical protein
MCIVDVFQLVSTAATLTTTHAASSTRIPRLVALDGLGNFVHQRSCSPARADFNVATGLPRSSFFVTVFRTGFPFANMRPRVLETSLCSVASSISVSHSRIRTQNFKMHCDQGRQSQPDTGNSRYDYQGQQIPAYLRGFDLPFDQVAILPATSHVTPASVLGVRMSPSDNGSIKRRQISRDELSHSAR